MATCLVSHFLVHLFILLLSRLLVYFITFLCTHFLAHLFTTSLPCLYHFLLYLFSSSLHLLSTCLFSSLLSRLLVDMFASLLVSDYGLDNKKGKQFYRLLGPDISVSPNLLSHTPSQNQCCCW